MNINRTIFEASIGHLGLGHFLKNPLKNCSLLWWSSEAFNLVLAPWMFTSGEAYV